MIVCHCHGTTDRQIAGAVKQTGACSAADVRRSCGAGAGCGGCRPTIARILRSLGAVRKKSGPTPRR